MSAEPPKFLIVSVRSFYIAVALLMAAILGLAVAVLIAFGQVHTAIRANHVLAQHIQHQRYTASLNSCLDSNARHDATLAQIHQQLQDGEQSGKVSHRQLTVQYAQTVLIIDALAPAHEQPGKPAAECMARAALATSGP